MTVKLILLKSGEDIIADVTEMVVGEEEERRVVGYFLEKPCIVKLREGGESPDSCRLWKVGTRTSYDKDLFRNDKGDIMDAYRYILKKLTTE